MKWTVKLILLWMPWIAPSLVQAQAVSLNRTSVSEEDLDFLQAWQLTLKPAAEPRPALKYSLWPRFAERTPGDATPHYYRALLMQAELPAQIAKDYAEKSPAWLANELDENTKQEARAWLDRHKSIIQELQVATYRERIDSDLRLQDLKGLETIQFLLPDARRARELARMLQVKARLEIADGRLDDALQTLRVGYRLVEFVAKTPTLVNDLVGIAIGSIMTHELTRLVAQPDAPNMYWAIAMLPRPLVSMREAFEWESGVPLQIFPFLKDAESTERSADEWRRQVVESYENLHQLSGDYAGKPKAMTEIAATALVMKNYPRAKRELIAAGMDGDAVETMSVGQVVAVYTSRAQRHLYDEMFKWTLLPHAQVYDKLTETERRLQEEDYLGPHGFNKELLPVASLLMPAFKAAWYAAIRLERQLAALRTIEAIRMHAAATGGQLPASLSDIQLAIVPNDPLYDKPFDYRIDGHTAVIETPPRPGFEPRHDSYRYTLRIKK